MSSVYSSTLLSCLEHWVVKGVLKDDNNSNSNGGRVLPTIIPRRGLPATLQFRALLLHSPSVLQWRFLWGGIPCCVPPLLPDAGVAQGTKWGWVLPDQAHFHCERDKVMAGLQGGVLGTLQMLCLRCHGSCLSSCRGNMWRCIGVWACGIPHKHLPRFPRHYWAPVGALSIRPVKDWWFQPWGDLGRG